MKSFDLEAWMAFGPAAILAASCVGPRAGGEGSESHFVCVKDTDCASLGGGFACLKRLCVARSATTSDAGGIGATSMAATADVCFGEKTRCEAVHYAPFHAAPGERVCDASAGDPLMPLWLVELDTVSCPAPGCLQRPEELLAASGGGLWINAVLQLPNAENPSGGDVVGASLVRLDPAGAAALAPLTRIRSRLSPRVWPMQGLHVRPDGGLFRAAPSSSFRGVELQTYDAVGNATAAYTAVEGSDGAAVAWSDDGSAAVAYSFSPVVDGGAKTWLTNVARFDSRGRLLWNRTKLEPSPTMPGQRGEDMEFGQVGLDNAGNTIVITREWSDTQVLPIRVLKLDRDGNPLWAIDPIPDMNAGSVPAWIGADGTIAIAHLNVALPGADDAGMIGYPVVDFISPDGTSSRRIVFTGVFETHLAIDRNRIIVLGTFGDGRVQFQTFDLSSRACSTVDVPVPTCGNTCEVLAMTAADGVVYFATDDRVGAVKIP